MFIVNWFWDVLSFFSNKNAKIVFLGLDNAGKTTLLHLLKNNHITQHVPTLHPTMEELAVGNMKFQTYDLGGHRQARKIWRDYFPDIDAVVYLVDSADRERLMESKAELESLLTDNELSKIPFLILGNKIDKPGAPSEDEFRQILGVSHLCPYDKSSPVAPGVRPVQVYMCSLRKRQGYGEGFKWLSGLLN